MSDPRGPLFEAADLVRTGKDEEAIFLLKKLLKKQPMDVGVNNLMGIALSNLGRIGEGAQFFDRAIRAEPLNYKLHLNYALHLINSRLYGKAEELCRRAAELNPFDAECWGRLSVTLRHQYKFEEAQEAGQKAIELAPDQAIFYTDLAAIMNASGRNDIGREVYLQGLERLPNDPVLIDNMTAGANYVPGQSGKEICALHRRNAATMTLGAMPTQAFSNELDRNRRLKIAYLSGDLRQHSIAYFMQPIVEHFDHQNFEYFAFATTLSLGDPMTKQIKPHFDHWIQVHEKSPREFRELCQEHQIDIIVDLHGLTEHHMLHALALKPAPVLVNYLGYPATTGLETMDYRIVDSISDPAGTEDEATETLVRVDPSFLCYRPEVDAPDPDPDAVAKRTEIVFGSFNHTQKLNAPLIRLWCEILKQTPNSRLLLKHRAFSDVSVRSHFERLFSDNGIDAARLDMRTSQAKISDHLTVYNEVDIALDTLPYNGTTTTCEALWMGVPVLTIHGNRHAERVSASLLKNVGLEDFIAKDNQDYVARATRLSQDRAQLVNIRRNLRNTMINSPLCDEIGMARRLEDAYRQMWVDYCNNSTSKP